MECRLVRFLVPDTRRQRIEDGSDRSLEPQDLTRTRLACSKGFSQAGRCGVREDEAGILWGWVCRPPPCILTVFSSAITSLFSRRLVRPISCSQIRHGNLPYIEYSGAPVPCLMIIDG